MMYVIIAYVIDSYILLLLYLSKVFPFSGIFLGDLMRYSHKMRMGKKESFFFQHISFLGKPMGQYLIYYLADIVILADEYWIWG